MFGRSSFFRLCVHNNFLRGSNASSQIKVNHQGTRRLHVANKVLFLLFLNIFGRGRLILIDDVIVIVFQFTGS